MIKPVVQRISSTELLVDGHRVYKDAHDCWVTHADLTPKQEKAVFAYVGINEMPVVEPQVVG